MRRKLIFNVLQPAINIYSFIAEIGSFSLKLRVENSAANNSYIYTRYIIISQKRNFKVLFDSACELKFQNIVYGVNIIITQTRLREIFDEKSVCPEIDSVVIFRVLITIHRATYIHACLLISTMILVVFRRLYYAYRRVNVTRVQ